VAAFNRMASFLVTVKWKGGDRLSLDRRDPGNGRAARLASAR
jgi:hypothetical protein